MPDVVLFNDTLSQQTRNFSNAVVTGFVYHSWANNITAHAGGTQAGALSSAASIINAEINRVSTVATAGDSVALPSTVTPGLSIAITNAGANSMQVFGQLNDTINGISSATGVAVAAGKTATFYSTAQGLWDMNLSA